MPPTSQFFQVPASGNLGKLEPVREHRQCLLFVIPTFFGSTDKYGILSEKSRYNFYHF